MRKWMHQRVRLRRKGSLVSVCVGFGREDAVDFLLMEVQVGGIGELLRAELADVGL